MDVISRQGVRRDIIRIQGHGLDRDSEDKMKSLGFPNTRSVLWDHRSTGQSIHIHLTQYRNPLLMLEEKTLWLIQRFAAQESKDSPYRCVLIGTVASQPDGEGVRMSIDRLNQVDSSSGQECLPGDLRIHCTVKKNAARSDFASTDDYAQALKVLYRRCIARDKIDMSQFLHLRMYCSYHSTQQSHLFHVDFDMVALGTSFRASPVNPVPIVPTALSKNLAGPLSLSEMEGEPKTGYLTMDHTRKLLLVLESDPKVSTLPLVGIWISGVHNVHDPFVWAACIRYLNNDALQDRVCVSPEPFLIVLYSTLHSRPDFYDCVTANSKLNLDYDISSCHEVIQLPKDSPVRPRSPLELELLKVEGGQKRETFNVVLQENSDLMKAPSAQKASLSVDLSGSMEDIMPRSSPAPHLAKNQIAMIKPSVPEVTLLFDENDQYQGGKRSHPHPHLHPGYAPLVPPTGPPQPPYPASFKERKSKKRGQTVGEAMRSALKPVNGVPTLQYEHAYPAPQPYEGYIQNPTWAQQQGMPPQSQGYGAHQQQSYPRPNVGYRSHPTQQWEQVPPGGPTRSQGPPGMVTPAQSLPPRPPHNMGLPGSGPPQQAPFQQYPSRPPGPPSMQSYATQWSHPQQGLGHTRPMYPQCGSVPIQYPQHSPHYGPHHPIQPVLQQPSHQVYQGNLPMAQHRLSHPQPPLQMPQLQHPHPEETSSLPLPPSQPPQQPLPGGALGVAQGSSPQPQTHKTPPASPEVTPLTSLNTSPALATGTAPQVNGVPMEVPPGVYELLRHQDTQLQALREQLQQLLAKQEENGLKDNKSDMQRKSTASQSSVACSPLKPPQTQPKLSRGTCEMAVNTTLFWPEQENCTPELNKSTASTGKNASQIQSESNSIKSQHGTQMEEHVLCQPQNTFRSHDQSHKSGDHSQRSHRSHDQSPRSDSNFQGSYDQSLGTQEQSHRSHDQSHRSHDQSHRSQDQSQKSHNQFQNLHLNDNTPKQNSRKQIDPAHLPSSKNTSPPRLSSNEPSPSRRSTEQVGAALSETCSFSDLQLNQIQDRTEDSYISMVVDMPGYNSLSPEKSPNGGSSGYGDTDDSSRSPALGESVSMYEPQNMDTSMEGQTQDQSEDTGLGDSHPQVNLLYKNQRMFYSNLIGNVQKFLTKHAEEEEGSGDVDVKAPQSKMPSSTPPSPIASEPPTPRRVVDMSVDVAAQTKEQLLRMGINTEFLGLEDRQSRADTSTMLLDPAFLPKINYISMMLDSDSDLSADADALAMKYLSDDQLTELARMRLGTPKRKGKNRHDPVFSPLVAKFGTDSTDVTMFGGIPANHMSFATKEYMQRYGLVKGGDETIVREAGIDYHDDHHQNAEEDSTTKPAVMNVKAFLEQLTNKSLIGGQSNDHVGNGTVHDDKNPTAHNPNSGSFDLSHHHSQTQNDESYSTRNFQTSGHSSKGLRQHSITSDTTLYHSPAHTPHHRHRRRHQPGAHLDQDQAPGRTDRTMESTCSAPSTPCAIRVLNDSEGVDSAKVGQKDMPNFEPYLGGAEGEPSHQGPGGKALVGRRILDIKRLKDLPKLL